MGWVGGYVGLEQREWAIADGLGWVVDFKANCSLVGPGPIGGVPSVEDLSKVS